MALDTTKRSSSTVDLTHYKENLHEKKLSMLACTLPSTHTHAHTHTHTRTHTTQHNTTQHNTTQHNNDSKNVVTEGGTKAGRILISVKFHEYIAYVTSILLYLQYVFKTQIPLYKMLIDYQNSISTHQTHYLQLSPKHC